LILICQKKMEKKIFLCIFKFFIIIKIKMYTLLIHCFCTKLYKFLVIIYILNSGFYIKLYLLFNF